MNKIESKIRWVGIDTMTGRVRCMKCGEFNMVTKASNSSYYEMKCTKCGAVLALNSERYLDILNSAKVIP
jgi:phage FluMu protein Com